MTGNKDNPSDNNTPDSAPLETAAKEEAVEEIIDAQQQSDDAGEPLEPDAETSAQDNSEALVEENIKESTKENDAPESNDKQTTIANEPAEKKSGAKGFLFLLLLILLLIIGLGIAGYYGWQEYQKQTLRIQTLEGGAAEQTVSNQALSQKLSAEQTQWASQQQQQFQSLQEAQDLLQQRLDSHSARIQGLAGTSRQDWLLAEVRYLLRLARHR